MSSLTKTRTNGPSINPPTEVLEYQASQQPPWAKTLREIVEGTAAVTGSDFFRSLVQNLAKVLHVRLVFVTECSDLSKTRVRTLAFVEGGEFKENIEYPLTGTPCEKVIEGEVCVYPDKLEDLFPAERGLKSYVGVPLHDSSGDLIGHLAILHDKPLAQDSYHSSILQIFAARAGMELERQRVEEEVRESEERFRSGFENASIGMAMAAADGHFLSVNKALCQMLGYEEAELLSRNFRTITFPDDLPESVSNFKKVLHGEIDSFQIEKRYVHKEGHIMWAITTASVVHDLEGKPWYLFAQIQDITERKRFEIELRRSKDQFQSLFENSIDAILLATKDGKIIAANSEACRVFDRTAEEILMVGRAGLIDPTDPRLAVLLEERSRTGRFKGELTFVRKDGTKFLGEVSSAFYQDKSGDTKASVIIRDITERKKADQALREALAEVRELKNKLQAENIYLQEEIQSEYNFEQIIGDAAAIKKVIQNIRRVADTDSTVLITGETGTGKELIARAIHNLSKRQDRPLIKVNCAALPVGLVESEFFGHEKGAFTGAIHKKLGRFELADGGTIFLDEIGDVPLDVQVKLLRVLQEQEFERVGGTETKKVNVRLIAATNQDLTHAVKEKSFRADLFYRLNVFPIPVPPLRERKNDIPLLAHYFVDKFIAKLGKQIKGISKETMNLFLDYDWPGNIRELSNVVERAIIVSTGSVLNVEPETLFGPSLESPPAVESPALEEIERNHILKILDQARWIINGPKGAAQVLRLHPNTLRNRMKRLGISRETHRPN